MYVQTFASWQVYYEDSPIHQQLRGSPLCDVRIMSPLPLLMASCSSPAAGSSLLATGDCTHLHP